MKPGTRVHCSYREQHIGTVLAIESPDAWRGSIAFGIGDPDPEAVRKHVAWCRTFGGLDNATPVAWDFGRVYWDRTDSLTPAEVSCSSTS